MGTSTDLGGVAHVPCFYCYSERHFMRYQSGATDTSVRKHCCWNGRSAAADLLEKGRAASMAMGCIELSEER